MGIPAFTSVSRISLLPAYVGSACVSTMMRTGTPDCHRLINVLEYRQSVMNQKDTSMPTVSSLISCRIGERQSWYEVSHKHSPGPAQVGGAGEAFSCAAGVAPQPRTSRTANERATRERVNLTKVVRGPNEFRYQRMRAGCQLSRVEELGGKIPSAP